MAYQRTAEDILSDWRAVERSLADAKAQIKRVGFDNPEARSLRIEIDELLGKWARLRIEYQQLVNDALANDEPPPTAWPEDAEPDVSD